MQSIQLVYGYQQGQETIQDIAGTPQSVCVQGLQSATSYRIQAILFDEGVELAQSNVSSFVTLGASAISLTLHNCSREGYNYRVHYLFSSTYTLSSAVLSCNGQTFQGTISGNTITFIVTGLTAGEAYLYSVTATDVYGFQETVTGSISTTVINEVNLYYNSRTENSVTFDLVYLHDFTFRGGWIGVWNSTDDPSTDNPISSEIWFDGDTQVTVPNLTAETTYKFRAGMTVEDGFGNQTTVYSSVVTATTADHDYSNDYFTIINEYAGTNTLKLKARTTGSSPGTTTYGYSLDGGVTWRNITDSAAGAEIRFDEGAKILLRHSGAMCSYNTSNYNYYYHTIECHQPFSVAGNPLSLTSGDNYTQSGSTVPKYGLSRLFYQSTNLVSSRRLNLGIPFTLNSNDNFAWMFYGCSGMTDTPSLPNTELTVNCYMSMFGSCTSITSVPNLPATELKNGCYASMFNGCTSLTTPMDVLRAKVVPINGYHGMFAGCTSLTKVPDLRTVTKVMGSGMYSMFSRCTALKTGAYISNVTAAEPSTTFAQMYYGCSGLQIVYAPTIDFSNAPQNAFEGWLNVVSASGTLYADSSIASTIPLNSVDGCPSGWTIENL